MPRVASARGLAVLAAVLLPYFFCDGGWIDPDTSKAHQTITSLFDGETSQLVFSDEFNVAGRNFHDGSDPRWTAMHKDDYTNKALHYYNKDLASTNNGFLNISTIYKDITFEVLPDALSKDPAERKKKRSTKTKNYQSAMIQGWNKFCFTGGIVEISARLPGRAKIGGLWPAMWMLGNLARATYVGSANNKWPWSYNKCSRELQSQQTFSACDKVAHYDMHPYQGRGAPEIDILEAMPGDENLGKLTTTNKPYFSTSLQIAPGHKAFRPNIAEVPPKGMWYEKGLEYGLNSSLNIFFFGMHLEGVEKDRSYLADAISSNTNIGDSHFDEQHVYRTEWVSGPDGYIAWYMDDAFLYSISAEALNLTGAIIPEEPMYLLFNTAISSTWGFPQPCPAGCDCTCFDCKDESCACAIPPDMCENLPADMLVDYVRVYQRANDSAQEVGCSTPRYPTMRYINGHQSEYKAETDRFMLLPVARGGGACRNDADCGGAGAGLCGARRRCECLPDSQRTGPTCMAHEGFDDVTWQLDLPFGFYMFDLPRSLLAWVLLVLLVLASIVGMKYRDDQKIRQQTQNATGGVSPHNYAAIGDPSRTYGGRGQYEMGGYQSGGR